MAQPKGPIGISVPEHAQADVSSNLTTPKRLEQWLAGLPRAHIGETSRLIYTALRDLNQLPLAPEQRLAALEALAEPTGYVVNSLRKHVLGQAFPLTPKKQKVAQLIRELLNETAAGYQLYLENVVNGSQGTRLGTPNVITALQRALHFGLLLLLNAYQTYAPHPKGSWQKLHRLYAFAVENGLVELTTSASAETADDIYKRILLLSLVNPYQLSQEDIQRIYDSLYFWAPYCVLTPMTSKSSARSMFAVNPDTDDPPSYYAYCTVESRHCLLLDTRALVQQVRELVSSANPQSYPTAVAQLPRDTLKRMLLSWGSLSKRAFTRRGNSAQVNVTLGLAGTYKFLMIRDKAPARARSGGNTRATFSSHLVGSADGSGLYPATWDLTDQNTVPSIYDQAKGKTSSGQSSGFTFGANDAPEPSMPFNITNESAGGFCLLWQQSTAGTLLVGDLICIHETKGKTSVCNICVIRWMKNVSQKMVLGVEILSPCAQPVSARIIHGDGARSETSASLILPPVSAVKRPVTLLTSPTFRSGDVLILDGVSGQQKVRLTHLLQSTRSFKQFQFAEVEQDAPTPTDDEAPGFDNIWSSL